MEWLSRLFALEAIGDQLADVLASGARDVCGAAQWLASLVREAGEVTDDEDLGVAGDGKVRLNNDAADTVDLRARSVGDLFANRRCGDTGAPDDRLRRNRLYRLPTLRRHIVFADRRDHRSGLDFDTEFCERFLCLW